MSNSVFANRYNFWFRGLLFSALFLTLVADFSFASSDGQHETKGWVATDSYRVFNFAILVGGIFLLVRKPMVNALSSRMQGIKNKLNDLEAQKIKIEAELLKYDEKLAKLGKEAETILLEYTKQGEKAKAKIIAEAEITADKLSNQAKKNIEHEFELAKTELQREVVEKALIKAEKIIKKHIGSDDQEKMIDEYLGKVVA